ncbi:alpha/beta fold hydrolase [Rhodococcoides kyotonense]|uniref:Pimeloyl-ACP methyl ester carboxylesterase n=1 Tax=Rhodococcoides kyotonense TaxID=398843 RepID=A0A239KEZ1_9NOCA|nr:alpha/beta fold hydrolase [Rhodococcus kyotonensis]SNT16751.1 Pimeloyl-ACP methyl ester carboxylesterase [Rhodococcus kyotonensis]
MTIERERHVGSVYVDGAELAVYENGNRDGPTLVLVHGWPDTHHLWDGVVPRLVDRFRVISYDTRGHGQSTGTGTVAEMRLEQLADDFMAVVDAVAGSTPVHVLAHDWGSVQVWEAICEPGAEARIASFTSISGPSLDHLGTWMRRASTTPKGLWQMATQLTSGVYTLFFMSGVLPRVAFRVFGRRWTWSLALRVFERVPSKNIHLADTLQQDMIRGLRIYRANIPRKILRPDERYTHVPVQLLVPKRDPAIRRASFDGIERWVSRVSRTDVRSGHWLPLKNPDFVATATASFIERISS